MHPTEDDINIWIDDIRMKLRDCRRFLDEKRQAYATFDRFSTVSEDPYSLQARTIDSRSDRSIIQWLEQGERGVPKSAQYVRSIDELAVKWREVHNFWTDLWEAVQRARVRAKMAEHDYYALLNKKSSSKQNNPGASASTKLPHISLVTLSNSGSGSELGSGAASGLASTHNLLEPVTPSHHSDEVPQVLTEHNMPIGKRRVHVEVDVPELSNDSFSKSDSLSDESHPTSLHDIQITD